LTVADAADVQSQKDVPGHVQKETRRTNGRKLRAETGQRRCGVCGNPGHNARMCHFVEEISEDE
ncbi:hypothetical protein LZ31DRAFT_437406, partial [Colletotrichum somersetense]